MKSEKIIRIRRTPNICADMERKMQPLSAILAHPRTNTNRKRDLQNPKRVIYLDMV